MSKASRQRTPGEPNPRLIRDIRRYLLITARLYAFSWEAKKKSDVRKYSERLRGLARDMVDAEDGLPMSQWHSMRGRR